MEVLMQYNAFAMFLFSGVLQMAGKIWFQKQSKRDVLLPEQAYLVKSGSREWQARIWGLELFILVLAVHVPLVTLQKSFSVSIIQIMSLK